jgi:quercetin dioxygenase-like cupin family protein
MGVPQVQAHTGIALRASVTETQMNDVVSILETKVGKQEAENVRNALSRVLDVAARETNAGADPQILIRRETQPVSKGPETNFTGDVDVQFMFGPNSATKFAGAYVTFQPGARTAWHTHSTGQHMVVISGVCWTQEWGKEKSIANPGDVVWCPPGVKHWHGASSDTTMTHFAITGTGGPAQMQWLEKVSDEQYYSR